MSTGGKPPVLDFEVQRFTRICCETDHEFQAGETFYSYLIREGSQTVRRDVAKGAWNGPPEDCLAWWTSEVPDPASKKMHWAPHEAMLHYFSETDDSPEQADIRYLLALLMVRRRIFRLEETEIDEQGNESLIVFCARNESQYVVPVVNVAADRLQEVQGHISRLLVDAGTA